MCHQWHGVSSQSCWILGINGLVSGKSLTGKPWLFSYDFPWFSGDSGFNSSLLPSIMMFPKLEFPSIFGINHKEIRCQKRDVFFGAGGCIWYWYASLVLKFLFCLIFFCKWGQKSLALSSPRLLKTHPICSQVEGPTGWTSKFADGLASRESGCGETSCLTMWGDGPDETLWGIVRHFGH